MKVGFQFVRFFLGRLGPTYIKTYLRDGSAQAISRNAIAEKEFTDQTCHPIQFADIEPARPSTDRVRQSVWQGSH